MENVRKTQGKKRLKDGGGGNRGARGNFKKVTREGYGSLLKVIDIKERETNLRS